MPLAFEIADEVALLALMGGSFSFEPRLAADIARSLKQEMLFFQRRPYGGVSFVAAARPVGIDARPRRRLHTARVEALKLFARPVEGAELAGGTQWVSRALYQGILAAADTRDEIAEGLQPALRSPVEALSALYRSVLAAYDYRCALSHGRLARDDLRVVALRPGGNGRPVGIAEMLPMALPFVPYFDVGAISVDEHHNILIDAVRVPPEVRAAVHSSGRLHLPADPAHWPATGALRHRRRRFIGGKS